MLKKLVFLAVLPVLLMSQPAEARRLFWWQATNPEAPPPSDYYGPPPPQDYSVDQADPYYSPQDQFNQDQYLQYRRELDHRYRPRATYQDQPAPDFYAQPGFGADQPTDQPYAAPVYRPKPKVIKKTVLRKPAPVPAIAAAKAPVMPAGPVVATSTAPAVVKVPPPVTAPVMPSGSIMAGTAPPATPSAAASVPPAPAVASSAPATPAATASTTAPAPAKLAKGAVSCDKGMGIVSSFGFTNVTSKSCAGSTLVYSAERSGSPFEIEVNAKSGELTAVKKL